MDTFFFSALLQFSDGSTSQDWDFMQYDRSCLATDRDHIEKMMISKMQVRHEKTIVRAALFNFTSTH